VSEKNLGGGDATLRNDHGTAVASLLATDGASQIYAANVFRGTGDKPFASSDAVVRALDWLVGANVDVINISLAGPRNLIVDRAIAQASARGRVVVAAAGNGGPAAPPAYPAAVPGALAVTAVDDGGRIYRYANRGEYIRFAARGVGIAALMPDGRLAAHSGTSFASPHVAAQMARCMAGHGGSAATCIARLQSSARDLGTPGRDPVYGYGVVD
jgi:subtilisin family serine protease